MKKNKIKIVSLLLISIFLLTGCTQKFTDEASKKSYTSNILCQPETQEVREIYTNNKETTGTEINELAKCKKMKINEGGYEGLWTSIFVKPLAWIIIKLGALVKSYGISIMILGLLLRVIMIPLTKKSTNMSDNMKKAKPELDKLERKYKNKDDKEAMMMKSQEMMMIYKKYNISPMSGCLVSFLQLPLFFAFLEAIQRIPVIFEEKLLWFELGITPLEAFKNNQYYYIIIIILIIATTYFSFKNMNTASMDDAQAKQMNMMSKFMLVFISIASINLPVAIAFYWIVSSGFGAIQGLIQKNKRK